MNLVRIASPCLHVRFSFVKITSYAQLTAPTKHYLQYL